MIPIRLLAAVLAVPLLAAPAPARAASSYDACTGFIPSLPATIGTQGVWCLNKDLNTPLASGQAVTITTNNVTIDCNGFKLGGLQAGPGTMTVGVYANGRSNATIRDCNIRGFLSGVSLEGSSGGGHRIERNRFEANTIAGLSVVGDGSLIRDNLVLATGGTTLPVGGWITGIGANGAVDVVDNRVSGVSAGGTAALMAAGIVIAESYAAQVANNRVGNLLPSVEGDVVGILLFESGTIDVRGNTLINNVPGASVVCSWPSQVLQENMLAMGEPSGPCSDAGDNYGLPVL